MIDASFCARFVPLFPRRPTLLHSSARAFCAVVPAHAAPPPRRAPPPASRLAERAGGWSAAARGADRRGVPLPSPAACAAWRAGGGEEGGSVGTVPGIRMDGRRSTSRAAASSPSGSRGAPRFWSPGPPGHEDAEKAGGRPALYRGDGGGERAAADHALGPGSRRLRGVAELSSGRHHLSATRRITFQFGGIDFSMYGWALHWSPE
jgi:hypothetical protein